MAEPPPPYSSSTTFSKKEKPPEIKNHTASNTAEKSKQDDASPPKWLLELNRRHYGDGKSCPLTCGSVSAPMGAWVLAPIYILVHIALIVKLREPYFWPGVRGLLTIFAAVHILLMADALIGLCRKRTRLVHPFTIVQRIESVLLTGATGITFCVLAINVVWCFASMEGDPFGKLTKTMAIAFALCAFFAAFAHFCVALFVRVLATMYLGGGRPNRHPR